MVAVVLCVSLHKQELTTIAFGGGSVGVWEAVAGETRKYLIGWRRSCLMIFRARMMLRVR